MKAIILAAGEGVRLRPITETRPKSMIPVLCRPVLEWHVEALLRAGFEEIVVVVSYMKDFIVNYFESKPHFRGKLKFVDQGKALGTGDAVVKASEALGPEEDVVITYADLYFEDWSIYGRMAELEGYYVVGSHVNDPRDYGVLYIKNSNLVKIVEKPEQPETTLVNVGVYKLNTRDIIENSNIPLSPRGEYELTDIVTRIASQKPVKVYLYQGNWVDIGKPWHVIEANKLALKSIKHEVRGYIIEPVTIREPVFIGENSTVYPYTTILGPVYIDGNVEVGPSALIRPWSVICSGSKIGFSVEVKESVIFENVHASHLTYIGDSVVCEHVNLGAGTVLANLRFDRRNVKMRVKDKLEDTGRIKLGSIIGGYAQTGVNVSIMPGVKIGSCSWVLPGSVVYRDVPSNAKYPQSRSMLGE
ncbi:MAG: sugar phosphate nucleotidyltransferase [Desulfurococcaceae archaeon]